MNVLKQKRGLANLLAILTYLRKNDVPMESAQAVIDSVYEEAE